MIIIKGVFGNVMETVEYDLDLDETKEIRPYRIVGYNRFGEERILGIYDSEERAKEVMEEIEEHIRINYINEMVCKISNVNYPDVTFQDLYDSVEVHKEMAIYTMPKE